MQVLSAAARWAEFDSCLAKLVTAANSMRQLCYAEDNNNSNTSSIRDCLVAPDAPLEAHSARDTVVAALSKLHMQVAGPSELLSQLAMHVGILTHLCPFRKTTVASDTDIGSILKNQMLACLHWLGEFQILAFIPHQGSIALGDIAELASVPENQLRRIVRMMTAAGFLQEPQPGQVEHTALSAPFGNRPSYHDALMFLTSSAAPAAMQMVPVTQRWRHQQLLLQGIACHSNDLPLAASIRQQAATPRRQWPSYLRYALRDQDSSLASIFNSFDWASLGDATVVDVSMIQCGI